MAINKRLLVKPPSTGITPSEHFGVVLYEGNGLSSHSINGGKFGAGAYTNGSNSNLTYPEETIDINKSHTISGWVNIQELVDEDMLFYNHDNNVRLRGNFSVKYRRNLVNTPYDINSTTTLSANTWYHIVTTFDTTNGMELYINGSSEGTNSYTGNVSVHSSDYGLMYRADNGAQRTRGKIDQVRIFQRALSSSEVSTLYAETVDTVTDVTPLGNNDGVSIGALQGAYNTYRFEDNVNDENSNNNGTAYNITYDSSGKFSKAASFNGSSSYIDLGTVSRASSMTLSAWVKTSGSNLPIVYLDNGTVFRINIESSGNAGGSNLSGTDLSGSTPVNDNNWHHILAVFNDGSSNKLLYVDGVLENSQSYSSGSRTYKDGIGIDNNNPAGAAILIDQVRIFRTALTPGQVKAVYTENALTASYRFEGNANDDMNIADGTASNVTYEYGLGFTPDFVWIKERSAAESHRLFDTTRGATKRLFSDNTNAESTASDSLTHFDSGGFRVGSSAAVNQSGQDYVAWAWKANEGTTSSNTDGSITTTVQANTDAGFSILKYNMNLTSGTFTIGHGLNSAPELVIFKTLGTSNSSWVVYPNDNSKILVLDSTGAASSGSSYWNSASPTSTVINMGTGWTSNHTYYAGDTIGYAFHSVDGFSKIGSYTGNGDTSNIVETGFEPAFIIIKYLDASDQWILHDNKRDLTNPRTANLRANSSDAEIEYADYAINFLSNGFELLTNQSGQNANGGKYLYMAFAADPDTEAPAVAKSFTTKTYTGTGSAQSIDGFGFKPNLLWIKRRTGASGPNMTNSVTGIDFYMFTDSSSNFGTDVNHLGSFDDDGFTTAGGGNAVNGNGEDYVAWAWKADDNEPTIFSPSQTVADIKSTNLTLDLNLANGSYSGSGTDLTDLSSAGETFSRSSAGNIKEGFGGYYIDLEGNDQYWTSDTSVATTTGNDITIEFWIRSESASQNSYANIIDANHGTAVSGSSGQGWVIQMRASNYNSYYFAYYDGSGYQSNSDSELFTLTNNEWTHIAIVKNGTSVQAYKNGSAANSWTASNGNLANPNQKIRLGQWISSASRGFNGSLAQVRLYSDALSSSEVTANYNATKGLFTTIQSIVSANANAGFSIVEYEGNGSANQKVSHGLSAAPEMIITKNLEESRDWRVFHTDLSTNQYLALNTTGAVGTAPTNTCCGAVASVGATSFGFVAGNTSSTEFDNVNKSGINYISYCFHSVSGYSKFGSYTGNGTAGHSITGLGFQPDWIMIKRTTAAHNWVIADSVRGDQVSLFPNLSNAESDQGGDDLVSLDSNGFTVGTNTRVNSNGDTFIYAAFKIN